MDRIKVREDVLRLKALISEPRNLRMRNDLEEFLTQLQNLGYRLDQLEEQVSNKNSTVEIKRKNQIVSLLRSKDLTSAEVGRSLKISRTRASEYLNALEKEGILRSKRIDRKKYYGLKEGGK